MLIISLCVKSDIINVLRMLHVNILLCVKSDIINVLKMLHVNISVPYFLSILIDK